MPRVLAVIPARYLSTRFPGKALAPLGARPGARSMVHEVWTRVAEATRVDRLVVATDDDRIRLPCEAFGAEVAMTAVAHASGTDRVAEVARTLGDGFDVVINVQGDEPLITGTSIDRLIGAFDGDPSPPMATLAEPMPSVEAIFDPNAVKVVVAADGRALYFSRSPIPFHRGAATRLTADFRAQLADRPGGLAGYRKHQGIYAYTRATLSALTSLDPSPLEIDEGLEQLRALEAGFAIHVVDSDFLSLSVDTPEDLERLTALMEARR